MRSFECTLATTTSSSASRSSSWSRRAVLEDVDLDPGEDAERAPAPVERGHELELVCEPLGVEPVRDGERRAEWSVSARYSWPSPGRLRAICSIGGAAVGPVGVEVAVAPQRGADRPRRRRDRRRAASASSGRRYVGHLPVERLDHDPCGVSPMPGRLRSSTGRGQPRDLGRRRRRRRRRPRCGRHARGRSGRGPARAGRRCGAAPPQADASLIAPVLPAAGERDDDRAPVALAGPAPCPPCPGR